MTKQQFVAKLEQRLAAAQAVRDEAHTALYSDDPNISFRSAGCHVDHQDGYLEAMKEAIILAGEIDA